MHQLFSFVYNVLDVGHAIGLNSLCNFQYFFGMNVQGLTRLRWSNGTPFNRLRVAIRIEINMMVSYSVVYKYIFVLYRYCFMEIIDLFSSLQIPQISHDSTDWIWLMAFLWWKHLIIVNRIPCIFTILQLYFTFLFIFNFSLYSLLIWFRFKAISLHTHEHCTAHFMFLLHTKSQSIKLNCILAVLYDNIFKFDLHVRAVAD